MNNIKVLEQQARKAISNKPEDLPAIVILFSTSRNTKFPFPVRYEFIRASREYVWSALAEDILDWIAGARLRE